MENTLNWKDRPILLKIIYIASFLAWCTIIVEYIITIVKSIALKQTVTILSDIEALKLSTLVLNITSYIATIFLVGFGFILFCAGLTAIYRKITHQRYVKASPYGLNMLHKKVLILEVNNLILMIISVYKIGSLIMLILEQASQDSNSGPLVAFISVPLLMVVLIMVGILELAIIIMTPFIYKWGTQLMKYMGAAKEQIQ